MAPLTKMTSAYKHGLDQYSVLRIQKQAKVLALASLILIELKEMAATDVYSLTCFYRMCLLCISRIGNPFKKRL